MYAMAMLSCSLNTCSDLFSSVASVLIHVLQHYGRVCCPRCRSRRREDPPEVVSPGDEEIGGARSHP